MDTSIEFSEQDFQNWQFMVGAELVAGPVNEGVPLRFRLSLL
jgi:hypothetical protein